MTNLLHQSLGFGLFKDFPTVNAAQQALQTLANLVAASGSGQPVKEEIVGQTGTFKADPK